MAGRRHLAGALGALIAITGACTSSGTLAGPTVATTQAATPTSLERRSDGVLRIGVLLPTSGAAQSLGPPMITAVNLAAVQINSSAGGGVNGKPVVIVTADETDDPTSAAAAADKLINDNVDAIIGPASSRIALSILGKLTNADRVVCSPANTAALLSDFPDKGYYFRTAPSDLVQATALARAIETKGLRSTSILAPDDDYGKPMARALETALAGRGIRVTTTVQYDPDSPDFVADARKALADGPDSVAVIALPDPGAKLLSALKGTRAKIFATNGIRTPGLVDRLLDPSALDGVTVTTLAVTPNESSEFYKAFVQQNGAEASKAYAAYAYDCAMLIALSATAAGTDDPSVFRRQMTTISGGGSSCIGFTDCKKRLIEERSTINYVGASGDFDLDQNGDPDGGYFDVFVYQKDGTDKPAETPQVLAIPRR
ncbi:MAG: ABC transporter substrate-binding protein [Acidimicrobiia bacterium]